MWKRWKRWFNKLPAPKLNVNSCNEIDICRSGLSGGKRSSNTLQWDARAGIEVPKVNQCLTKLQRKRRCRLMDQKRGSTRIGRFKCFESIEIAARFKQLSSGSPFDIDVDGLEIDVNQLEHEYEFQKLNGSVDYIHSLGLK